MRKCFDALKRLKNLNKKKKEIQQRLFNYYEIRYIRRPLKIWHQNNKIWLAQRAMQKVQVFQAFQRIKQFYLHKKREGTINNLLKYYERTSSPYLSKNTPLEIQNKKTSKETQLHANGFSKKIQECSSQSNQNNFLSTEYLDKENNSYLCNVNPMIESEAQECYGVSRKYSKTENQNGFISNTLKQEYKKELRQKQQISVSNSLSQTHTQDSKKNEKMLTEQSLRQKQSILTNNIQDKNQQYFNEFSSQLEGEQNQMIYTKKQGNIQNYQSIQISEYGINNSTEISDNELNCCNMKSSINELNAKAKHQMSQNNFDISGIINDKSSMVYNCTRNTLNSERNNYQKTLYSANSCFLPSKKNNNLNKQQANEESLMDHQEINFNNLESNQNSTFSEKSQFYLNNEIISGRQKDTINLFDPIKNYQKILSHNASVEQLESKQLSQRNNLNEPNLQRQTNQGTDIICNQKSKIQESQQLIFFHKQINYQESSLTPSKDIQKNLNNQIQCSSNQIKPSSAFTFTHSQIKNSLNVPTQQTHINQKEEHNLNQSENHNLNDQQSSYKINNPTNSFKQAGKIKKNSFNRSFQESEEQSEFNNELNGHAQDSGKKQNTFASRGKHNYSFSQNINYVQNQEKQIINDRVNNLNNDSNGLVSFVNRNRSCNRINQQLEQQAEAFNAKKLTLSRNSQQNLMSIENKINQDQTKNSKQDGRNLFQNSSLHQNSNEINQDKFLIHSVKPPLQNNQLKTDRSSHNRSIDIKQPISTKQQLNMQQLEQMAKIEENLQIKSQNFLKKDLNPQNPQDSKSIHNIQEINQIVNQKQKSEAAAPFRNFIKDEFASNPSNLSLHQLSQQEQQKEIMNSSTNQIQSFEQVNLSYLQQKDSILSNLPHNYQNHLKNQQFSQMIQETAKQIEKRKLPITQKKQEQINQLQQYQYFKQIQQQRIQQQQQSNKINSNNTSVNNSFSRNNQKQQNNKNNKINDSFNTSQERNKKRDLSNVGQSIQNILYFEAKIRSKRLARSQERSKNDSTELCKKLENLEQYIQQINHELIQEKEKKQLLIQENAYLINQSQQI